MLAWRASRSRRSRRRRPAARHCACTGASRATWACGSFPALPGPGDILDGEIDASDRLEVSRTAYREAVRILAAKGLVESRPKVGTRVSLPERWHLLDPTCCRGFSSASRTIGW
jgi:hypothetical protein